VLKLNPSVTSIDLSNNHIRAEGASALAGALKLNMSLTSINLSYNDIRAEGASALAGALELNTSVTSINLSDNQILAKACWRSKVEYVGGEHRYLRQ
jgi:Ran GTPase-activating protein (RanGAP) involved in mRNA processing and transport